MERGGLVVTGSGDQDELVCPACRSDRLSPPGTYASFENHLRWKYRLAGRLGGRRDLTARADRGRVCLSCGHVSLYVDDDRLQQLRESLGAD